MIILTLSGSARPESSNRKLLNALASLAPGHEYIDGTALAIRLPLFLADREEDVPAVVKKWKSALRLADALVISTPEYLHNLPALIKNAFEWIAQTGELVGKAVLCVTFTPHPPRGEKAMESLQWSLNALDAKTVGQVALYREEVIFRADGTLDECEGRFILSAGLNVLNGDLP